MTAQVAPARPPSCPRCGAPVRGTSRFCSICAYRLQPREALPPDPPRPRRARAAQFVVLGLLVGVLAGLLVAGRGLFGAPGPGTEPPRTSRTDRATSIAHLEDALEFVPRGIAYVMPQDWLERKPPLVHPEVLLQTLWRYAHLRRQLSLAGALRWPAPLFEALEVAQEALTWDGTLSEVEVPAFLLQRHEVTCGQWAEFLGRIVDDAAIFDEVSWVTTWLWQPVEPAKQRYARGYVRMWREQIAEDLPAETLAALDRELTLPLESRARVLLLAPPQWITADETGAATWRMPEGAAELPVTGISQLDALIFVTWARYAVDNPGLKLPNVAEWIRAFHDDHPDRGRGERARRWPWGNDADPSRCNNLDTPREGEPRLAPVLTRYTRERRPPGGGWFAALAGNAAEWVKPFERWRHSFDGATTAADGEAWTAQAAGGSYLDPLEACAQQPWPVYDRRARLPHVGFRLACSHNLLGGR